MATNGDFEMAIDRTGDVRLVRIALAVMASSTMRNH